jgi:hypothetical protein
MTAPETSRVVASAGPEFKGFAKTGQQKSPALQGLSII